LAVVALVWILVCQPEARGRHIAPRLVVVLSGTTAFGFVHVSSEYFTMGSFGGGNGGTPIGYGYLIFATITISAILTVIMTLLVRQKVADAEPHQDHRSRPYDAADVSRSPVAGRARVSSMPKQLNHWRAGSGGIDQPRCVPRVSRLLKRLLDLGPVMERAT
jgi:uncharacterized membrane protein